MVAVFLVFQQDQDEVDSCAFIKQIKRKRICSRHKNTIVNDSISYLLNIDQQRTLHSTLLQISTVRVSRIFLNGSGARRGRPLTL